MEFPDDDDSCTGRVSSLKNPNGRRVGSNPNPNPDHNPNPNPNEEEDEESDSDQERMENDVLDDVSFPDDNDEGDEEERNTISWGDVKKNQWFHVISTKDVTASYGPTKILTLRDREGKLYSTWSAKMINESIDDKMNRGGTLFIKSLGKKKTKSGKKKYYDIKYKLMQ